jgi:internalin A
MITSTTPQWALDRIAEAQVTRASTLDLCPAIGSANAKLTEIPPELFSLVELRRLLLSRNEIAELPNLSERFPQLEIVDVAQNPIVRLADQPALVLDWRLWVRHGRRLTKDFVAGLKFRHEDGLSATQLKVLSECTRLRVLELYECRLTELPAVVTALRDLQDLDVSNNALMSLPSSLAGVTRLESLKVYGNRFKRIPSVVFELAGLRVLNAGDIGLERVPPEIEQLPNLEQLYLHRNFLQTVPSVLATLGRLRMLTLSHNKLAEFPGAVTELADLVMLRLRDASLPSVPADIGRLRALELVDLASNQIERLPDSFFELTNLRTLNLGGNRLRELPPAILDLPRLETLTVDGNPIENLPPELLPGQFETGSWSEFTRIARPIDLEKVRAYFRQLGETGTERLCEAKLIVVGEGEAGKTTFVRKLIDPEYVLDPGERATEGIDVVDWSFPACVHVGERGSTEYVDTDINVHIWDFAGQEITYSTHQFFLTKRSLYALVVDNRRDNPNFDYWLNVIELLSDGSPLLIVKNEKQDLSCAINESGARGRFPNIKEVLAVNLATNRGLEPVAAAVRAQLQTLPHIGTPLPASWKRVREALLERRHENYISRDALLALCEAHGFQRLEDKLQLSEYLHDLGTFLHFQNDAGLAGIVILRPEWATKAVYRVLRDREVVGQNGRLHRRDLARIWSEDEYQAVRGELLELMRKFKVCYPLGESDEFMIPQLLPRDQPAYRWDPSGSLQVYYEYDFMPKGIVPRLTVALYRAIERQDWVWQSGVIFAREGARAEVIEDRVTRKIRVRVVGRNRLQLVGAIAHALDDIHGVYHRLGVRKMIPCQCRGCVTAADPFFFQSDQVRENALRSWAAMQCHRSGEMVPVATLLGAVGDEVLGGPETDSDTVDIAPARNVSTGDVFVSYAWGGDSETLVERIDAAFATRGLHIVRDKKDVAYKADISAFMARLGRGDAIITVISDRYLRSENCMRELLSIAETASSNATFVRRIFPIVLADAAIYDLVDRLDYVQFWEQKRNRLADKMKRVDPQHLHGFREAVDLYDRIRDAMGRIVDVLATLNTLTPDHLGERDFERLFDAVLATVKPH